MNIRQATKFRKTYPLDIFGIDQFIDELEAEMVQLDIERQNRLRIRLSLEESLLRFRDRFGDEEVFEAAIIRNFGHPAIQITLVQDVFNPLSKEESDFNDWSGSVLISAGLSPQFSYSKGVNVLRIILPAKRLNPVLKIAIAIAAGILTGVIIAAILSDVPQMHVAEYFFQPFDILICNAFPAQPPEHLGRKSEQMSQIIIAGRPPVKRPKTPDILRE